MKRFAPGDVCMISYGGSYDGMVVVLREQSPHAHRIWRIEGKVPNKNLRNKLVEPALHERMLILLREDPGVDEINLVRMARSGSKVAADALAMRRTQALQSRL